MRALLDINVLIALLDPDHVFNTRARQWWTENADDGWASCPLTENGVVRIMSNPAYSRGACFTPPQLIHLLRQSTSDTNHQFWPDDLSLRDHKVFNESNLLSSKLISDHYLLALAVKHRARLATFDQAIPLSAVHRAAPKNLCLI